LSTMSQTKLFLIDDDETMLSLLCTLLGIEGFDVKKSKNLDDPTKILANIEAELPDLVLLDVHMQQYSGFDLLHLIRKSEKANHIQVLMSSGMDVGKRCTDEGADGFILKPYMPEDLIHIIQKLLALGNQPIESEQ
jgi:DNA-binding response OmpR family regulator